MSKAVDALTYPCSWPTAGILDLQLAAPLFLARRLMHTQMTPRMRNPLYALAIETTLCKTHHKVSLLSNFSITK